MASDIDDLKSHSEWMEGRGSVRLWEVSKEDCLGDARYLLCSDFEC